MGFNLSEVPTERWEKVTIPVLLDYGEFRSYEIEICVGVYTPDELRTLRDECVAEVGETASQGREVMPSEEVNIVFLWKVIKDWKGVEVDGKEGKIQLPYNRENLVRVCGHQDALKAISKKAIDLANRNDLLEKN